MSVNSRLKATKIIGQRKASCNIPRHWNAGLVSSRARLTSWGEGALVHDSYLLFLVALILHGHSTFHGLSVSLATRQSHLLFGS